jgi:hypothetical protein
MVRSIASGSWLPIQVREPVSSAAKETAGIPQGHKCVFGFLARIRENKVIRANLDEY